MDSTNRLTIYDLTQPTEMHKDYGWWHILRDGCGLADVQNQHEGVKIVEELQRRADEVHWLRAEVERLRADYAELHRAFWLLRRVTLPPHDISGTSMWGEALSIANALPAPPAKEEE